MKNLKIGVKILIGFGLVIFMMAVVTLIVILSNRQTINNVSKIESDSTFQTMCNNLRENFLEASIPANVLLHTVDESEFDKFQSHADEVAEGFLEMYEYLESDPVVAEYRSVLEEVEGYINDYFAVVRSLNSFNQLEVTAEASIASNGVALSDSADAFVAAQIELIQAKIDAGATDSELLRHIEEAKEANAIMGLVISFRVRARIVTLTYKTDVLPDLLTTIDDALDKATTFRNTVQEQRQKSSAQMLINALTNYRKAFVDFGRICDKATESAEKLPPLNNFALEKFNEKLSEIDEVMINQVQETSSTARAALFSIILITLASLVLAIIIAFVLMVGITKPMSVMYNVIEKVKNTGNLKFTVEEKNELLSSASNDEIGRSIKSFSEMLERLSSLSDSLDIIAGGDLSISVEAVSESDTMGMSMIYMLENLNDMFLKINEASEQVNSSSEQVSSASQALAQGATMQASSIEQLSASVQEISEQVNDNSRNAEKASLVADETGDEVQKGNEQMQQMLKAMDGINSSSNEISKIIKVIDDIAFQTNILALNAAVEAARAGEAGKGFAVVAEEVRNLASKSADAAKQTNDLIASSIQSVNIGAGIAQKTAESLANIEEKSKEVNEFVTEIANASKEQAAGISQINAGVEQISNVVQTNSATAEESAAAAEALSGQASMLTEQIAHFKLR